MNVVGEKIVAEAGDTHLSSRISDILRTAPIFSLLTESELAVVRSKITMETKSMGELVFGQGEQGDCLYVIVSGRVRAFQKDAAGNAYPVGAIEKAYVWGRSQTGRCIRDFVHAGFNEDSDDRGDDDHDIVGCQAEPGRDPQSHGRRSDPHE